MKVKELISVMAAQTQIENPTLRVVLGFEDDETYFCTWLPEFSDLDRPEYTERFIRSLWFSQECNTICLTVSGGI